MRTGLFPEQLLAKLVAFPSNTIEDHVCHDLPNEHSDKRIAEEFLRAEHAGRPDQRAVEELGGAEFQDQVPDRPPDDAQERDVVLAVKTDLPNEGESVESDVLASSAGVGGRDRIRCGLLGNQGAKHCRDCSANLLPAIALNQHDQELPGLVWHCSQKSDSLFSRPK